MFGQSTTSVDTMNESSFSSSDATNARRRMAHDTPSFSLGAGGFDTGEIGAGRGGGYAYAAGGQWLTQYLRRVWSWDQIDYDSTFDQMVTLMGAPKHMSKVYKLANYRKKTKNQWARDDPGFAMIQLGFLAVSTLAWGIACLQDRLTVVRFLLLLVKEILGHWLVGGLVLSGVCASLANRYLILHSVHSVAQTVEWLYAFDIHCNSFFVSFLLTHIVQLMILPLLLSDGLTSTLCANALWALAIAAYFYVTHLGYCALPFLTKTEYYLYPVVGVVLLYVAFAFLAVAGYRFNMTRMVVSFYFG
mmetsp:Transcript_68625/g.191235  ORF Transcript_68625/g.191235 Transcript_68625/m.191235 type:complete len:303 (-) Transcript_68625:605-1513(-)